MRPRATSRVDRTVWRIVFCVVLAGRRPPPGRPPPSGSVIVSHRARADFALTADPGAAAWKSVAGVVAEKDRFGKVDPRTTAPRSARAGRTKNAIFSVHRPGHHDLYVKPNPTTSRGGDGQACGLGTSRRPSSGPTSQDIKKYKEFQVSPPGGMGGSRHRPRQDRRPSHDAELELRLRGQGPGRPRQARLVRGHAHPPRFARGQAPKNGAETRLNLYRCQGPPGPQVHQLAAREQRDVPHAGSLRQAAPGQLSAWRARTRSSSATSGRSTGQAGVARRVPLRRPRRGVRLRRRNGAGKTTTIKNLTGLIRPTSGDARVGGHSVLERPPGGEGAAGLRPRVRRPLREFSFVEYLTLIGPPYRLRKSEYGAHGEELRSFGLEADKDKPMGALSKGTKQKVCWISALLHEPEVLVLDEPLNGLDEETVAHVKEMMRRRGPAGPHDLLLLAPDRHRREGVHAHRRDPRGAARERGHGGRGRGRGRSGPASSRRCWPSPGAAATA